MRSFVVLKEDLLDMIVMLLNNLVPGRYQSLICHTLLVDLLTGLTWLLWQTSIIARVSRNPTKPQFNHYMFEALAALIRNITAANPATVPHFEQALFPSFQHVIENQVSGMESRPLTIRLWAV
mgnify:FL=1